jgi:hypothetical protein
MTENSKQVDTASKTSKSKSPVIVTQRSAAYWRVTFDNPPMNLFDPEMTVGLHVLMDRLDQDKAPHFILSFILRHRPIFDVSDFPMLLGFWFSTDRTIDSIRVSFYHHLWDF